VRADYQTNYEQIAADHIAHWRATGENPWQPPEHVQAVGDATREILRRYTKPGDMILDAGCGMGELLEPLTDRQRSGLDLSAGYVEIARSKGIDAEVGDLEHMPYADGAFAAVVAVDVLEHVLDLNAVVAEMLRVLRPGGVFVVRSPDQEDLAGYLAPTYPYRFAHLRRFDEAIFRLLFTRIFECEVLETSAVNGERNFAVRKP
jgi:SAM-dependent methyltransferase